RDREVLAGAPHGELRLDVGTARDVRGVEERVADGEAGARGGGARLHLAEGPDRRARIGGRGSDVPRGTEGVARDATASFAVAGAGGARRQQALVGGRTGAGEALAFGVVAARGG